MSPTPEDGEPAHPHTNDITDLANVQDETLNLDEVDSQDLEIPAAVLEEDADALPQLYVDSPAKPDESFDVGETTTATEARDDAADTAWLRRARSPSINDSASIPDDTPSVRESVLSSPRSESPSIQFTPLAKGANLGHRPFDKRFQSRLSSSPLASPRANSPAFLAGHSRQSSLASVRFPTVSEPDDSAAPWEVMRWTRLKRLTGHAFSELGRRKFGVPTCLAVSDHIVLGTSRGILLIFDHQQNLKAVIGNETPAIESGSITSLAISADHSTVAAGHATGHIFTWEIARAAKPFLHIMPIEMTLPEARRGDGHVAGSSIVHIGFLGFRHTAVVSADDRGMAFSHLATRGMGLVARSVRTTRVLGRYPDVLTRTTKLPKKSSVLAFAALPLGNVEQSTDNLGLVALMTPYLLVLVSTTPIAQTQHKAARPRDVAAHGAMTAALAWFPAIKLKAKDSVVSKTKLAYAWSDVLTILEIHEVSAEVGTAPNKGPDLHFISRSRYKSEEAIVAVQWLSRSVLAVLTISQQLLIIEDVNMNVTDSFDLLPKNIYHADLYSQQLQSLVEQLDDGDSSMHGVVGDAFHMSFRTYKGRLYLLGSGDVWWGILTNWADRLLALMDVGDFIGAVRLATNYYTGTGDKLTIGLPEDDAARADIVREKLLEMMSASLKYAFGKNQRASTSVIDQSQLTELAVECIAACIKIDDRDFLFDEVFAWYDDHGYGTTFVDVLEPYILEEQVISLPPAAVKTLITHFAITHSVSKLEEIICLLDTATMDIDQVTRLCKQHHLYDAYIYVWNKSLGDYTGPLDELLLMAPNLDRSSGNGKSSNNASNPSNKLFPYISFILTSRTYPTSIPMEDSDGESAKRQIYEYFFSGRASSEGESFGSLRKVLHFDASSFMSAMNEAFEDSYLNTGGESSLNGTDSAALGQPRSKGYNRNFIVRIMLDVMSTGFETYESIYLDMFIARNLPKYPQYMLLSGTTLQQAFDRLCRYPDPEMREDAQLSVEYLLSVYHPPNSLTLVPLLQHAQFFRILKAVYRQERQYADMIRAYFADEEDNAGVFDAILALFRSDSTLSGQERSEVEEVMKDHAHDLIMIDVSRAATVIDEVAPELHHVVLDSVQDDGQSQFFYLRAVLERDGTPQAGRHSDSPLLEQYVQLMCRYDPAHVADYVSAMKEGDLRLEEVIPTMESSGIVDAAVLLLARQGQVAEGMQRLIAHLEALTNTLHGILQSASDSPDAMVTTEAIQDLVESIRKYVGVGIWLCQTQTKAAARSKTVTKSPRRPKADQQPLSLEDKLWFDLMNAVVAIARGLSPVDQSQSAASGEAGTTSSLRPVIQSVFTALLTVVTAGRDGAASGGDFTFLRILRAFLSHTAKSSPSLLELRSVLASIFSAYAYEESLLALSNAMLDKDLFVHVDEVTKLRQRGWRPRGQLCEVCRTRVWGAGSGLRIWAAWEEKEDERRLRRQHARLSDPFAEPEASRGKGKALDAAALQMSQNADHVEPVGPGATEFGPIVAFSCRHLYHQRCLENRPSMGNGLGPDHGSPDQVQMLCPECASHSAMDD